MTLDDLPFDLPDSLPSNDVPRGTSHVPRCYKRTGPGKRPKIATFDFETIGLGGKVVFATWMRECDEAPHAIKSGNIAQELFWIMCENHDYEWFAHNAQYDLRYLIEHLKHDMDRLHIYLRTDSDVFMVVLDLPEHGPKARLVIKDSYALFPAKLEEFAQAMCPDYPKLTIEWEKEQFDAQNKTHVAYALRDAEALLKSIIRYDQLIFETFDVHIKATAASTALAGWQRSLTKAETYSPPHKKYDDFIRSAYYGGLVFLTTTNKVSNSKTYDINSSYPYQLMTHEFPIGNPIQTDKFHADHPGIYTVTIRTPDDLRIPILPKRDSKGIMWLSGTFETTVTSVDLAFALAHGYRLLGVHDGLFWTETCRPFRSFIELCRKVRHSAGKDTPLDIVAKRNQNSFYGKLGTKRIRRKIYSDLPPDQIEGCEQWGDFLIRDEYDEDMLALPQWAAFVTAYARIHLLTLVHDAGIENVLYGDTDSLTVLVHCDLPTGTDYGALKLEKEWTGFRPRAPKVYAGIKQSGEIAGAIKGVPRKQWLASGALDMVYEGRSDVIHYQTLPSFMNVLGNRPSDLHEAKRSISELSRSRSWQVRPDGSVWPRNWQEIEARRQDAPLRQRGGAPEVDLDRLAGAMPLFDRNVA